MDKFKKIDRLLAFYTAFAPSSAMTNTFSEEKAASVIALLEEWRTGQYFTYNKHRKRLNEHLALIAEWFLSYETQEDIYHAVRIWYISKFLNKRVSYHSSPKDRKKDNSIWGISSSDGGASNRHPYRIPSKKRSKRVWKNFYNLFPNVYKPSPDDFFTPIHV